MFNPQNFLLALLIAIVATMLALIYANMVKKEGNNKKAINNLKQIMVDIDEKETEIENKLLAPSPHQIIRNNNNSNNNLANNNSNNNGNYNNNNYSNNNNNLANNYENNNSNNNSNNNLNNNANNLGNNYNLNSILGNLDNMLANNTVANNAVANNTLSNNAVGNNTVANNAVANNTVYNNAGGNNNGGNNNGGNSEGFYGGNHPHYSSHGKCGRGFGVKGCGKPNSHSSLVEGFEDEITETNNTVRKNGNKKEDEKVDELKGENEKLKKYLKIHGLYPENHAIDMSKFILKSQVKAEKICPDMSKYMLKTSVPPPVRCPKINRDEFIRKSELPPNWNKECPKHPDLTNYVLKSTIPPTTKSQACICPKVTVNAGLCREPSKEDCMAMKDVLAEACPKPEPCPEPKCPELKCPEPDPELWIKRSELPPDWNKKCPEPPPPPPPCPRVPEKKCPELKCAPCPVPKKEGKCPPPEKCPPVEPAPKCYDIKYIKVPVVKSEPLPKPNKETIFPTNLIDTKLVRQQVPLAPRQPKVVKIQNSAQNAVNNMNTYSPAMAMANEVDLEQEEIVNTPIEEQYLAPSDVAIDNSSFVNAAPSMVVTNKANNLFNKVVEKIKNVANNREEKNNRELPKEIPGTCQKEDLNKMFQKFGARGFNNQL